MAESEFTAFARAKINLTLRVLGKRPDGYHELDSLVVFADVGDRLSARPSLGWEFEITGLFAGDLEGQNLQDNLVMKAVRVTQQWARTKQSVISPLHFSLEKNLPVASGIGGGSADAAAAIKLCLEASEIEMDDDLMAAALTLGADIPVCLYGKPAWMSGIGGELEPATLPDNLHMVLVNPGVGVSTADVFKRLDAGPVPGGSGERPDLKSNNALIEFLKSSRNDLETPARAAEPLIGTVLEAITASGASFARISGSGATCFGIYETQTDADKAVSKLATDHSDWWSVTA